MLRRAALLLTVIMLPAFAGAVEVQPKGWGACETDLDCSVVNGPCRPEAVNTGIADQATAFFAKQKPSIKCPKEFWDPKANEVEARCRLGRCEIVGK